MDNNNDETTPMRHIAHNKSALADLFGWTGKPKPLAFDPRLPGARELEAAIVAHIGGAIQPAPYAENPVPAIASANTPELTVPTETQPQPTVTPQFGEMWRRNSDGELVVVVESYIQKDEIGWVFENYDTHDSGGFEYFLANYTRVTPKPGLNWVPIAEWDERDKSKRYLMYDSEDREIIVVHPTVSKRSHSEAIWDKYTHFAEINLPETGK